MAHRGANKKTPEQKAVVDAQRSLERAEEALERWEHQRDQYALELADAERSLGEKVVSGVAPKEKINRASTQTVIKNAADHLTALRAEHEAATKAAEVARGRIDQAQRNVWTAQADEMLARAKKLRTKAAKRQERTDELLTELQDWEGVLYVPEPGPTIDQAHPITDARGIVHYIPKTAAKLAQAEQLEAQAQSLQQQAANTPEARAEAAERERQAREETLASINADNQRKREEGLAQKVVDAPLGAGPN